MPPARCLASEYSIGNTPRNADPTQELVWGDRAGGSCSQIVRWRAFLPFGHQQLSVKILKVSFERKGVGVVTGNDPIKIHFRLRGSSCRG
jgi:hypothetical protein